MMGTAEEIQGLRQKGMTDAEIVSTLKTKGVPESEVVNSLSQSKIKDAVSAPDPMAGMQQDSGKIFPPPAGQDQGMQGQVQNAMPNQPSVPQSPPQTSPQGNVSAPSMTQESYSPPVQEGSGEYVGMQPSMMSQQPEQVGGAMPSGATQEYGGDYTGGMETGGAYGDASYQPYQEAMGSDMITEIAEQVVSEKLSYLRDRLEEVLDVRTVMEARIGNLNDRLKRIEKILDQLQLSILQKVGEYVNDVKDIKKELEETQKSFSSLHKKHH